MKNFNYPEKQWLWSVVSQMKFCKKKKKNEILHLGGI